MLEKNSCLLDDNIFEWGFLSSCELAKITSAI